MEAVFVQFLRRAVRCADHCHMPFPQEPQDLREDGSISDIRHGELIQAQDVRASVQLSNLIGNAGDDVRVRLVRTRTANPVQPFVQPQRKFVKMLTPNPPTSSTEETKDVHDGALAAAHGPMQIAARRFQHRWRPKVQPTHGTNHVGLSRRLGCAAEPSTFGSGSSSLPSPLNPLARLLRGVSSASLAGQPTLHVVASLPQGIGQCTQCRGSSRLSFILRQSFFPEQSIIRGNDAARLCHRCEALPIVAQAQPVRKALVDDGQV
mmetsp:Transcript_26630/g.69928  ORF Transcript_26630/g.69928 Transcript_26630/m.69928 type:complete len:264 (+) Transcript_26630:1132-1923(+)